MLRRRTKFDRARPFLKWDETLDLYRHPLPIDLSRRLNPAISRDDPGLFVNHPGADSSQQ